MRAVKVVEPVLDGLDVDEDQVDEEPQEPQHAVDLATVLRQVESLSVSARVLEDTAHRWVLVAREVGGSWQEIADALGVDKSTARRRFSDRDDTGPVRLAPGRDRDQVRADDVHGASVVALEREGL